MKNRTMGALLKAVALAMWVAVIVLNIVGNGAVDTSITLLGIGLFAWRYGLYKGIKQNHRLP